MVKMINTISDRVNEIGKVICACMMGYLAVVCTLQVFCRCVLNSSLSWSEESMRYVFAWMILIATASTVKEGSGAAIDLLKKKLKHEKAIAIHEIILFALTGVTAAVLVWYGTIYAHSALGIASPAIHIPMTLVYACIPVGSLLTLIHCIDGIISAAVKISNLKKQEGGNI